MPATAALVAGAPERIKRVKKYILFDHDGVLVDTEFWYYKAGEAPWPTSV